MMTRVAVLHLVWLSAACDYSPSTLPADDDVSPSCFELEPTCGASGTEDCCTVGDVPGGTFDRGRDLATDGMFTDTSRPATVQPFALDTYEITVGRFRRFVDAGMGTRQSPPSSGDGARLLNGVAGQGGWDPLWNNSLPASPPANLYIDLACDSDHSSWTADPGANESAAMSCVTWYEAFAFCAWDGGFLPTEAEWGFAAAGGGEQRAYPWSVPASSLAVDCSFANFNLTPFCADSGHPTRAGAESPKGDGRWGHAGMAGNVGEWVLDGYLAPYADAACDGCANLTNVSDRVIRGGNWANGASTLRTSFRDHTDPGTNRDPKIGFRCARERKELGTVAHRILDRNWDRDAARAVLPFLQDVHAPVTVTARRVSEALAYLRLVLVDERHRLLGKLERSHDDAFRV